jgi:hypothetical protein
MSDIIIDDAEFLFAENVLCTYIENLEEACAAMNNILFTAYAVAIDDIEISAALQARQWDIQAIMQALSSLNSDVNGSARGFIEDIDKIDTFIY